MLSCDALRGKHLFLPYRLPPMGEFFYFELVILTNVAIYYMTSQNIVKYRVTSQTNGINFRFLHVKNLSRKNLVISAAIQMFLIVL